MNLVPIDFDEAKTFVTKHHRHHRPPQGHKFSLGCSNGERIVGVVIVGRPVARRLQDGLTLEVTRLCSDGTKNACSFLYAAAWRATRALGYTRLITYILKTEPGTSLKAAGWKIIGETAGRSWNVPSRPRVDKHTLQERLRYEMSQGESQMLATSLSNNQKAMKDAIKITLLMTLKTKKVISSP